MSNIIIIFTIFLVILTVSLIFLLFLINKIKKVKIGGVKKRNLVQLPEIIDEKIFISSNGYRHNFYYSNFNRNEENIYIFIHDIFGLDKITVNNIKETNSKAIFCFKQRGYESKNSDKSFYDCILDYKEFINISKKRFSNKKIYLISEGMGQAIAYKLVNFVDGIIMVNPILDIKKISISLAEKIALMLPIFSSLKKTINLEVNYKLLSNKKEIILKSKNSIKLRVTLLYLHSFFTISKKIKDNKKILKIIQSNNDIFYNGIIFNKKFKNKEKVLLISSINHFLSYDKNLYNLL